MIDTLFICKANVQRSQVAEGLYNHYSKKSKAISCAGIEARKEKYDFKPEQTIANILLKDGVNIQEQKINYIADFSTNELSNIKKVIFLFDPNIENNINPECLIDGISPYKYFQNIKSTKIIIHKIKDPYKLGLDETIKIYKELDNYIKSITIYKQVLFAKLNKDKEDIFKFFKIMWKELFDIDFNKNIEKRKDEFYSSIIYYRKNNNKILAASQFIKIHKGDKLHNGIIVDTDAYILGRIGVLKKYRNKGLGTNLINHGIKKLSKKGIKVIYIPSEINNVNYYSKFGFQTIGKSGPIGNTMGIYMKKEL